MDGQLVEEERETLKQIVLRTKPNVVAECGTWRGGGSTLTVAKAIAELWAGDGMDRTLYTWELNPEIHRIAREGMAAEYPGCVGFVRFHCGDFVAGIESLPTVDLAVLDGPDDAEVDRICLAVVAVKMQSGALVFCHDWKTEKCRIIRTTYADMGMELVAYSDLSPTGYAVLKRV